MTWGNQSSSQIFRHGGAYVKLTHLGQDVWSLHDLWSDDRGKGHAKEAMCQAMDFADKYDLTILLVVQMYGTYDCKMLDNFNLEAFYKKFNFERTHTRPVRMIRHPQGHILKE